MADLKANPAPLGLMGFGMTTVLLNLQNAGLFTADQASTIILALGVFYGGLAQIFAGIFEYRNGNTFGTTAFLSYGLFWMSLVAIKLFAPFGGFAPAYMGCYLFLWGLFTCYMWVGTWKKNRAIQTVFLTLTVLFWLLAVGDWTGIALLTRIAGFEGILCGLSAFYLAAAEVLNEAKGRTVLPVGTVKP
jgi:succinate-acetate transporter protein